VENFICRTDTRVRNHVLHTVVGGQLFSLAEELQLVRPDGRIALDEFRVGEFCLERFAGCGVEVAKCDVQAGEGVSVWSLVGWRCRLWAVVMMDV